jgi:hypothetical protein
MACRPSRGGRVAQYLRMQRLCWKKGSAVPLLGQEGLRRSVAASSALHAAVR